MSKVSVLIAVYNAERYLKECLDSVCSQSLRDIQIVCVDDCSTDSSLEILERYAERDERIRVIHLDENQGIAAARNTGLKFADGEYVMMLDSDDWLGDGAIEKVYNAVSSEEDIDCALFNFVYYYEDTKSVEPHQNRTEKSEFSGEEACVLSLDWSLHGLYMVRTAIHRAHPYDASCKLYSDENTTRLHYLYSRRVVLSDGIYYYRRHSASMTTSVSVRRFDYMEANLNMKRTLMAEAAKGHLSDSETILNRYETHRWLNVVDCYWLYFTHRKQFTDEERREIDGRFADILATIERHRLPLSLRLKFGYIPFRSYRMFSLMENCYFGLRRALLRR